MIVNSKLIYTSLLGFIRKQAKTSISEDVLEGPSNSKEPEMPLPSLDVLKKVIAQKRVKKRKGT